MAKTNAQIQEEYRRRVAQGVRMLRVPVGFGVLDILQDLGLLDGEGVLDWGNLDISEVGEAVGELLRRIESRPDLVTTNGSNLRMCYEGGESGPGGARDARRAK